MVSHLPPTGDVNADRLRSQVAKLDSTAKQHQRRETLHRKADELIEAAGSRRKVERYAFSPAGGVDWSKRQGSGRRDRSTPLAEERNELRVHLDCGLFPALIRCFVLFSSQRSRHAGKE